jgi:hypothetical protein
VAPWTLPERKAATDKVRIGDNLIVSNTLSFLKWGESVRILLLNLNEREREKMRALGGYEKVESVTEMRYQAQRKAAIDPMPRRYHKEITICRYLFDSGFGAEYLAHF